MDKYNGQILIKAYNEEILTEFLNEVQEMHENGLNIYDIADLLDKKRLLKYEQKNPYICQKGMPH